VNAYGAGTTFCLAAGTYHPSSLVLKSGDVLDGGNRSAVFDGGGTIAYAVTGASVANVTIKGLTVQNYANPLQTGAIQSFGTTGWVIENNHITHNAGAGVTFDGGAQVIGNLLDYNTQEGYACHGNHDLFKGNTIAYNNAALTVSWGWEAGGGKCWGTQYLTVDGNYSHDNGGPGLWTDTDNAFTTYSNNTVANNYASGIMHEVSWSATITGNTATGNGFGDKGGWLWDAGILLSSSGGQDAADPIVVSSNTVTGNYDGITVVEQSRGSGAYGTYQAQNVHVSNNTVSMSTGATGVATDYGDTGIWGRNITFAGDHYTLGSTSGSYFAWAGGLRQWASWQSYGNDVAGSMK
jgi:parallel beta-helix repeat protein